jgi:hypothetical protein
MTPGNVAQAIRNLGIIGGDSGDFSVILSEGESNGVALKVFKG